MVIDCHSHLWLHPDGGRDAVTRTVDAILRECERLGIDRICISGLGPLYYMGTNDDVQRAFERHPDRIIGLGCVWLGTDSPFVVDDLKARGFKGLKVIAPSRPYDDPSFFPVYEHAAALGMPILFHLGIVARTERDRHYHVSMAHMRPVCLDPIARSLPELKIIGAHFGNPWYEEAAELARMHENVYFDLTGSSLKKKSPAFFKELLWWDRTEQYLGPGKKRPFEKILFGTDVRPELMEDVLRDYQSLLDFCNFSTEQRAAIMGETAAKIFGLSESETR